MDISFYIGADRQSPFEKWFLDLDAEAAAKVTVAISRLGQETSQTSKPWEQAYSNTGSIGGQATESVSDEMGRPW